MDASLGHLQTKAIRCRSRFYALHGDSLASMARARVSLNPFIL